MAGLLPLSYRSTVDWGFWAWIAALLGQWWGLLLGSPVGIQQALSPSCYTKKQYKFLKRSDSCWKKWILVALQYFKPIFRINFHRAWDSFLLHQRGSAQANRIATVLQNERDRIELCAHKSMFWILMAMFELCRSRHFYCKHSPFGRWWHCFNQLNRRNILTCSLKVIEVDQPLIRLIILKAIKGVWILNSCDWLAIVSVTLIWYNYQFSFFTIY